MTTSKRQPPALSVLPSSALRRWCMPSLTSTPWASLRWATSWSGPSSRAGPTWRVRAQRWDGVGCRGCKAVAGCGGALRGQRRAGCGGLARGCWCRRRSRLPPAHAAWLPRLLPRPPAVSRLFTDVHPCCACPACSEPPVHGRARPAAGRHRPAGLLFFLGARLRQHPEVRDVVELQRCGFLVRSSAAGWEPDSAIVPRCRLAVTSEAHASLSGGGRCWLLLLWEPGPSAPHTTLPFVQHAGAC